MKWNKLKWYIYCVKIQQIYSTVIKLIPIKQPQLFSYILKWDASIGEVFLIHIWTAADVVNEALF